jgi:protein-S-isoprenylcysteine O-methyltransferase Ste14
MSLVLRNLLFTVIVPGSGAVWVPWWILTRGGARPEPAASYAVALLFVIGHEEPTLRRRFGETYSEYRRSVRRWIPRRPQRG